MGVIDTLKKLNLKPRRTIRVIAWMNEENGTRGGKAYFDANKDKLDKHLPRSSRTAAVAVRSASSAASRRRW
jgi:Zn-dependent M28 family amino/carboxypeptidase